MKKFVLLGLVSLLIVSGVALAHQSEEQRGSSMQGMMQQMMGGETADKGKSGMGGMMNMMGMMGQMNKMMDQCTTMMGSGRAPEGKGKQEHDKGKQAQ
ncbi:MAG: hypothetical protein ACE5J5_08785 [Candidatus Hydrothermarchaeales archaeon]